MTLMIFFILHLSSLHGGLFILIEVKTIPYKQQLTFRKDCEFQTYSFATRRQIHVTDCLR